MNKRRFSITEDEGKTIIEALRYLTIKNTINEKTPLETVGLITRAEKLYIKLINYQWEKI